MWWFWKKWSAFKVYGPTVILYGIVAAYLLIPVLEHAAAAEQVKSYLDTVINHGVQSRYNELTGHPKTLNIDRLGINLSIARGAFDYSTHTWTLDPTHLFVSTFNDAQPIVSTDMDKQPLKVVFYGHNTGQVLLKTEGLVVGDILKIGTSEGATLTYYYVSDVFISPESTAILHESRGQTSIALVTCNGLLSTTRRVMYFAPLDSPNQVTTSKDHHND